MCEWRYMRRFFLVVVAIISLPISTFLEAQQFIWPSARELTPQISTTVQEGTTPQTLRYGYTIFNAEDSKQGLDYWAIELPESLRFKVNVSATPQNTLQGWSAYNQLESALESPPLLTSWSTMEASLPPASSQAGFELEAEGLPGIANTYVQGFIPLTDEPVFEGAEEPGDDDIIGDGLFENSVYGRTLGPTAPPAVFDPAVFMETIRGYVAESQTLGWLTDAGLVTALNGALDAAATGVSSNDVGATKTALLAFIAALPVPPAGTTACSTECAGLLYFNAQYLLDQLPTTPDLTVTQVSASQETVEAGANVDVTITLYNAGGGNADPSNVRLLLSSDATADLGDTSLGDIAVPALEIGASETITTTVIIPSTIPAGPYTLGACADSTGIVTELSETNNCAAGGTLTVTMPGPANDDMGQTGVFLAWSRFLNSTQCGPAGTLFFLPNISIKGPSGCSPFRSIQSLGYPTEIGGR